MVAIVIGGIVLCTNLLVNPKEGRLVNTSNLNILWMVYKHGRQDRDYV